MKKILTVLTLVLISAAAILSASSCRFVKYTNKNFFELEDNGGIRYQIHRPAKIKGGVKYPVLIYLHASGENDYTLTYEYRCYFLTCYGLINDLTEKINNKPDYYESYVVLPVSEDWGPSHESVAEIIDALIGEEAGDSNRIYLAGTSMGGFAVSEFIFAYPDIPACAAMISGCNYYPDKAGDLLNLPVRLYHSEDDKIVSAEVSRTFYNGLKDSGDENIEYYECSGYGHSCWNYAYGTGLLDWMYEQDKGANIVK